ncbi:hypothetical protein LUZ63_017456 [Rhynchospora breviuscula]|uniref:BHLH domain-containing protein n=1 Tax=Rhynchospora breviuscula TaxID=2022672 RepID=A0A9Q0HFL3_9POAL|nr:hypothetical protein LUZ63_017456 [Rhynchospora breviuscula]
MAAPIKLQQALQSVVQSVQWTYSLFWQLCPQQGILVWRDGYYNGAIKTRKTVQPTEVSTEEAALHRSKQLRELYDSLSTSETGGQPVQRRPCASLSPEDLTESEWFYLMCISYSFPPGVGLPGKAYARRRHVWLAGANEADSKVFSRAILAKSACIQTVVCIPVMDGVLELGTTDKVEEDIGLVQHTKSFFPEQQEMHIMPALSEQSTSNPISYTESQPQFNLQNFPHQMKNNQENDEDEDDEEEDDEEANDDSEEENVQETINQMDPTSNFANAEPSELMQVEMSEGIRLGSPDDCSNNFEAELQMLGMCHDTSDQVIPRQDDAFQGWQFFNEDLSVGLPQSSAEIQDLSPENAHYSETVTIILQHNHILHSSSNLDPSFSISPNSMFSRWSSTRDILPPLIPEGNNKISQYLLKKVLIDIPNLHCISKDENLEKGKDGEGGGGRCKKNSSVQEELSANHVLAERRRREKLNERFIILRSLVPFVTKMDKASILGDAIEYVKQLRKRIQELETRNKQLETSQRLKKLPISEKRKIRAIEGGDSNTTGKPVRGVTTDIQVSIIEQDALLELQCPYKEGLLINIMQTLHELRLEVISVNSSMEGDIFVAEFRAKVKDMNGKKASILEVKKALNRILALR